MDLINISRVLVRRRLWVGIVAAVALIAGTLVISHVSFSPLPSLSSRQFHIGEASIHVLVDTPSSQVADLDPPIGSDALAQRAVLFANLMGTQPVESAIATKAGIRQNQLLVIAPSTTTTLIPTPIAVQSTGAPAPPADYRLTVKADETLPIITFEAEAPNAVRAAALANGAFVALSDHLAAVADAQKIPANRRPVVTALGGATAGEADRGPKKMFAPIVAIVIFVLGCSLIVIADGLPRRLRELKLGDEDEPIAPSPPPASPPLMKTNGVSHETNGIPHEVTTRG